jgi:hypothetical protein
MGEREGVGRVESFLLLSPIQKAAVRFRPPSDVADSGRFAPKKIVQRDFHFSKPDLVASDGSLMVVAETVLFSCRSRTFHLLLVSQYHRLVMQNLSSALRRSII